MATHKLTAEQKGQRTATATRTVDRLNAMIENEGPVYIYAVNTNKATGDDGIAHGRLISTRVRQADKTFRVGVNIEFDGKTYENPSRAGSEMTSKVREKLRIVDAADSTYDGWNRIWVLIKRNALYAGEGEDRWIRMRLKTLLNRKTRTAAVEFTPPDEKRDIEDGTDKHMIISSADSLVVVMKSSSNSSIKYGSRKRKVVVATAPQEELLDSVAKRLKVIPDRLLRHTTALYRLYRTTDPAVALQCASEDTTTLRELLDLGAEEIKELTHAARKLARSSKNKEAASVTDPWMEVL